MNRNIRSHRHAESRFRHARDERIGDWQNRQRVLFADVQKFLDGTALTDTLLEYDNARDKEIDTLRATIDDETVRDALIDGRATPGMESTRLACDEHVRALVGALGCAIRFRAYCVPGG